MSKLSKKHWIILCVVLFLGVIVFGTWALNPDLCSKTKISEVSSPNGGKATLYTRECGALAGDTTQIELFGQRLFVADGDYHDKVTMRWDSEKKFVIDYSGDKDRLDSYYKLFQGIDIELIQH